MCTLIFDKFYPFLKRLHNFTIEKFLVSTGKNLTNSLPGFYHQVNFTTAWESDKCLII